MSQLTHRFKNHTAVDDVSFQVRAGSLHGFVGPNGAGKTTCLKGICTLSPVQVGSIRGIRDGGVEADERRSTSDRSHAGSLQHVPSDDGAGVCILIAVMGLTTSMVATGIARVQSSVKSQIAYSSIAQIGIIFIEVAVGLETLALVHFAGIAFLRTYQLLVSPSVVSYLIPEQFYNFRPRPITIEDSFPRRIGYSLYLLFLKEWNLDSLMYRYLWNPLKQLGRKLDIITLNRVLMVGIPAYLVGLFIVYNRDVLPEEVESYFPYLFSLIALVLVQRNAFDILERLACVLEQA